MHRFCLKIFILDDDEDKLTAGEIHRKSVASAIWNCQVESELKEQHMDDFRFNEASSREVFMQKVDEKRALSTYSHENCSDDCKERG